MRSGALAVGLFMIPLIARGGSDSSQPSALKKPWQWTDEERVTERVSRDPVRRSPAAESNATSDSHRLSYVISGKTTPELFMPFELFDSLIKGVGPDPAVQTRGRRVLDPLLRDFGFEDTDLFWYDLETIARPYLDKKAQHVEHHPSDRYPSIDVELCASRFAALTRARQHFGRLKFDELLYRVIAPGLQHAETTTYSDPGDMLLYEARGCK
jgi:hypothetical protein